MSEAIETNKLFVGNLHWDVRWGELKEFFGQWGEVAYASVSLDRETRRSRGFGFVTFVNAEDAAKAKKEAQGKTLNERELFVDFARARPDAPDTPAEDNDDDDTDDSAAEEAADDEATEEEEE